MFDFRIPSGYAGDPVKYRKLLTGKLIKYAMCKLPKTKYYKDILRDKFGIDSTGWYLSLGDDFTIAYMPYEFDLNKFIEFARNLFGEDDIIDEDNSDHIEIKEEPPKKLLNKLVCECCNGKLDSSDIHNGIIKCKYCGVEYLVNERKFTP